MKIVTKTINISIHEKTYIYIAPSKVPKPIIPNCPKIA
jgi:hypothetical protein